MASDSTEVEVVTSGVVSFGSTSSKSVEVAWSEVAGMSAAHIAVLSKS